MIEHGPNKKPSHRRGSRLDFGDIVGQTGFKQALLAVAANDDLGGLLVRGEKGTAKSTAVRALRDLLPTQRAVADCPYGCHPDDPAGQCRDCRERADPPAVERSVPLVTLPLGATRERVVGTLSVADAMAGDHEFDPGLLAHANRGLLYVDEVNLLDDHLVDVLLDAAADGYNRVERDGVSRSHPAAFTLLGTMNPEEGELRPQLRDRFALQTTVTGCSDLDDRVAVIDRALGRDDGRDDDGPTARERLARARELLPEVDLPADLTREVATLCREAGVDGHRGDIATARAARTLAALRGRTTVVERDLRRAAELALGHRLASRPFEDAPDPEQVIEEQFDDGPDAGDDSGERGEGADAPDGASDGSADGSSEQASTDGADGDDERSDTDGADRPASGDGETGERDAGGEGDPAGETGEREPQSVTGPAAETAPESGGTAGARAADEAGREDGDEQPAGQADADPATPLVPGQERAGVGEGRAPDLSVPDSAATDGARTGGTRTDARPGTDGDGARVRTVPADATDPVDAAASVRAAATRGSSSVGSRDLRQSVRTDSGSALVLFVVDASASMRPAMRAAKGVVLELLQDAYEHRDEVAFVAFAGEDAGVVLPPTDSVARAARHLKELPSGDRTPLPAGLRTAADVLDRADPDVGLVVLVTDGRANVAGESPVNETETAARRLGAASDRVLVVDAGDDGATSLTDEIGAATGGERVELAALSADRLDRAVDPENQF